jgi:DNA invertase Pin-like site-specific DNA recombinase
VNHSSSSPASSLRPEGVGAAYIRISDDQQDTARQYDSIHAFEKQHHVSIAKPYWFVDEGWARDTDQVRPAFQRLLRQAAQGAIRWIVVDRLDRFGTRSTKRLFGYLADLEDAGCRLYDVTGKDWTAEDDATEISLWVSGKEATKEPRKISQRVTSHKGSQAARGEFVGGPPRFGFDVACYDERTGAEVWRLVYEGRHKRLQVFADGRQARWDGQGRGAFPQCRPGEVKRFAPSCRTDRVDAAVEVFRRFATETITPHALAHYLNKAGFRNSRGGPFQGGHVERMLTDPIYRGTYAWNKTHAGKYHRYRNGQPEEDRNYDERRTRNDPADWVCTELFAPLVDDDTWAACQRKMAAIEARPKKGGRRPGVVRSPEWWLSGLLTCVHCGRPLVVGPSRSGKHEYLCSTYQQHIRRHEKDASPCLRNAVFQEDIEPAITRYLDDVGACLTHVSDRLSAGDVLVGRLRADSDQTYAALEEGLERLAGYLQEHHPDDYNALLANLAAPSDADGVGTVKVPPGELSRRLGARGRAAHEKHKNDPMRNDLAEALVACYRARCDREALDREVRRLDEEHSRLMRQYAGLTAPRARHKADTELKALEEQIRQREQQRDFAAESVLDQWRQLVELNQAVAAAREALDSPTGERALRRKAEALRRVVDRIDLTFTVTGRRGSGPGRNHARLAKLTFVPPTGASRTYVIPPSTARR